MTFTRKTLLATLAAVAFGAAPLAAATIVADEASVGDFGNNPNQAIRIGSDVGTVLGGQKNQRDSDYLFFDGFEDGTTSLDFSFSNPAGSWGGLNLRIKDEAFKNVHDWWPLEFSGTYTNITDNNPVKVSFALEGYTGPLYVALDFFDADFRNGDGVSYTITKSGFTDGPSEAPSTVPVPAALPLALSGIGTMVLMRRFRRKS